METTKEHNCSTKQPRAHEPQRARIDMTAFDFGSTEEARAACERAERELFDSLETVLKPRQ